MAFPGVEMLLFFQIPLRHVLHLQSLPHPAQLDDFSTGSPETDFNLIFCRALFRESPHQGVCAPHWNNVASYRFLPTESPIAFRIEPPNRAGVRPGSFDFPASGRS